MLTFQPKFIRALWYTLPTQSSNSGFASPLNLIAKGIQIRKRDQNSAENELYSIWLHRAFTFILAAGYEIDRVIPILVTFCALFGRLIASLHDGEFCQDDVLPGAVSKIMPFCLAEIGECLHCHKQLTNNKQLTILYFFPRWRSDYDIVSERHFIGIGRARLSRNTNQRQRTLQLGAALQFNGCIVFAFSWVGEQGMVHTERRNHMASFAESMRIAGPPIT